jgi:hypothetical protein
MRLIGAAFVVYAVHAAAAAGQQQRIQCPEAFPAKSLTATPPSGWKGGVTHVPGSRLVLTGAGIIVGPPKAEVQGLIHPTRRKVTGGFNDTYHDLTGFTQPQEKWGYCAYGLGGDVQWLQRLPDDTDQCVAQYRSDGYNGYAIQVVCQGKPAKR